MDTIRLGARGPDVELLQTALQRAGTLTGAADGVFGPITQQGLIRFQRETGLVADGIAGPLTWGALLPYLRGYAEHTIRPGDTLYFLTREYNTTEKAILTANPGIIPGNLTPGHALVVPYGFPLVPTNIHFTSTLLDFCVEGLTARYPFIGRTVIGKSVLGKPLHLLTIGKGRNEVMANASHHANEWITTPVLMRFLEQYAAVLSGLDLPVLARLAADMYDHTTLFLVPMVNPDGVNLVTGVIPPGSAIYEQARAMNVQRLPFPSGWKANIKGVDLNLNYPAGWERARDIKFAQGYTQPGPRDYVGPHPLSEPESRAMAELTRTRDFSLTLSYHTQGEVIYWRYLDYLPPNSLEIAQLFSQVSGYAYEETPYGSGHAGYKDWFIQEHNRPGYTIECGRGVNPLPIEQFDRIYRDNIGILTSATLL